MRPKRSADNLTTFTCQLSRYSGSLNLLEPQGPVLACNGVASYDIPGEFLLVGIIYDSI